MMLGNMIFLVGVLITGLDHRFGCTRGMGGSAILAENSGAGFRIGWLPDVREGDKHEPVCLAHDSGKTRPESDLGRTVQLVRLPIYFSALIMSVPIPGALGSIVARPFFMLIFLLAPPLNEEKVLSQLPSYEAYRQQTRFRFLSHVW